MHGKHSIDFGFQYDRQTFNELGNQLSRGNFVFQSQRHCGGQRPGNPGCRIPAPASPIFCSASFTHRCMRCPIAQANYERNVEAYYFDDNYKLPPKLTDFRRPAL